MPMREMGLSLLVRQCLALGAEFSKRYAHDWLVWEAGEWDVPLAGDGALALTRLPSDDLKDCLPEGDARCFELALAAPGTLRLGRAPENDIIVTDATVSREHVALLKDAAGNWTVKVLSQRPVVLNRRQLEPAEQVLLQSGDRLNLGTVWLTFYRSPDFGERVKWESRRLTRVANAENTQ